MSRYAKILLVLSLSLVATAALAQATSTVMVVSATSAALVQVPVDAKDVIADVFYVVQLGKLGAWAAVALVLAQLAVFFVRIAAGSFPVMKKYGTLINIVLGGIAALLASVVGGMAWPSATLLFLTTAAPKFVADILSELAHQHEAPAAPVAAPPAV